ncbi:hypothetical protein GCM10009812_27320 [Nocardioides marinus]
MSSAMSEATAPYSVGPSSRAEIIWNAYVATFMTAIATAIPALLRSSVRRSGSRRPPSGPPGAPEARSVVVVTL